MSNRTITLPNGRACSDFTLRTRLKDGGVALEWSEMSDIKVRLFSDAQRAIAGKCAVRVDGSDPTILICVYSATKPQYLGVNSLIVSCTYRGRTKTYDKPAVNIVPRTADLSGQQVVLDDPVVDVEIEVTDVSSSILDEVILAALAAADRAEEAAEEAEHMVNIHRGPAGKSAYQVAVDNGFVGTEEQWLVSLVGPAGLSAYQIAVAEGFEGTVADWLASLVGPAGDSAYEIAVEEGFVGTKQAWLASLVGPQGLSAYQVAVVEGFEGTVSEWLASLVGATPDISIGIVTTGEPGTPAAASMTGTPEAPVLNLTIPKGARGVGIDDIEQTVVSHDNGGTNTVRITLENGDHYDVQIRNGKSSAGLFPDAATLASAHPSPSVGDYAFVGDGFPADIYICTTAGTWTDSGNDYDGDGVVLSDYATQADLQAVADKVNGLAGLFSGRIGIGDTNDSITPADLPQYTNQYGEITLTLSSAGYLWMCLEEDNYVVESSGIQIPMDYFGVVGGLYCYVSSEMLNAGTVKFAVRKAHKIKSDSERLVITARSYTITYGDALPTFGYTANGEVTGTPSITCAATSESGAGTYQIVISRGTVTDDNAIYVNGTLTIEKAELTVTADDKQVELGGTMPAFTVQYSGFVNNDDASDLTTQPTCTTNAQDTSTAGFYTITPSGGVDDNYSFVYVSGQLRVGNPLIIAWTGTELFNATRVKMYISTEAGKWITNYDYSGLVIDIHGMQGRTLVLERGASAPFIRYAFLRSADTITNNGNVDFSQQAGYTSLISNSTDQTIEVTIPSDANYLYVYTYSTGNNYAPSVTIYGAQPTSVIGTIPKASFTANKTITDQGQVYTGTTYASTICCTTNLQGVEKVSYLYQSVPSYDSLPSGWTNIKVDLAYYSAGGTFLERDTYALLPASFNIKPGVCFVHLMVVGKNGTEDIPINGTVPFDGVNFTVADD